MERVTYTFLLFILFIHADLKLFSVALLHLRLNSKVQLGILSCFILFNMSKLYRLKARLFDFLTETVNMRTFGFGFGFRPKEVIQLSALFRFRPKAVCILSAAFRFRP